MELFRILGLGFVTGVAVLLLKPSKPELSFAVLLTGVLLILFYVVDLMKGTISIFAQIAKITGIENAFLKILIKMVGIGYLTEFGAGILQDFGVSSIADKVVIAGKLTILILSMPIIESVLKLFLKLISIL